MFGPQPAASGVSVSGGVGGVNGANEPLFALTTGSEKALLWLDSLQEARFVGTESRLESIFTGLDEILRYASADPDERIRRLENEANEIRAEIDRIRATGAATSFSPVQINERHAQVLGTARELLSDFRQVEENFKRVARESAERQTQPGISSWYHQLIHFAFLLASQHCTCVWGPHLRPATHPSVILLWRRKPMASVSFHGFPPRRGLTRR